MTITAESELAADDFQEVLMLIAVMDVENCLEDVGDGENDPDGDDGEEG